MPLKSSKIALQTESLGGRKSQSKPGKISLHSSSISNDNKRGDSDNGLPIDLSKQKDTQQSFNLPSKFISEGENGETVSDDLARGELLGSDEPLNLSTNGASNSLIKRENLNKDEDLQQKRVRLEEMVNYIRKCSVVEEPKYCVNTAGYVEADSELSNAESENDELPSTIIANVPTSGPRRKPHGNGVIRLSYANEASYPLLRKQLFQNLAESDVEEEDEEESIDAHPHWSVYDYASYYASVLHDLHSSAAAQSLLMATTSANVALAGDTTTNGSQQTQQQPLESGHRKRAPRALTGKHVKHGTGASPATLLTLRQKIEQKMNQQQPGQRNHADNGQAVNSVNGKRGLLMKSSCKKIGSI